MGSACSEFLAKRLPQKLGEQLSSSLPVATRLMVSSSLRFLFDCIHFHPFPFEQITPGARERKECVDANRHFVALERNYGSLFMFFSTMALAKKASIFWFMDLYILKFKDLSCGLTSVLAIKLWFAHICTTTIRPNHDLRSVLRSCWWTCAVNWMRTF